MGKIKKFSTKLKKIREQVFNEQSRLEHDDSSTRTEDWLLRFIDHALTHPHPSWERIRQSELGHDDFEQELLNRINDLSESIDGHRYRLQLEKDRWGQKIKMCHNIRELYLGIRKWLHYQKPDDIRPSRYASPLRLYEDKKKDDRYGKVHK